MISEVVPTDVDSLVNINIESLTHSKCLELLREEIQKRELLEFQLTRFKAHLDTCQRIAHIGSWELGLTADDELNDQLYWSEETYKILGYIRPFGIPTFNAFLNAVHPDDRQLAIDAAEIATKSGSKYDIECRIITPAGIEKTVRATGEIILDEVTNAPVKMVGVTQDITERTDMDRALLQAHNDMKTYLLALKSSELKFRSLIENSSDGIAVSDSNRKIIFSSASLARITGYSLEEILYSDMDMFFQPGDKSDRMTPKEALLSVPGSTVHFTSRLHKKDASVIWVEGITQNLLHDPSINGLVTNYRDITERFKHEEILRASNEHLQKTNHELDRFVYSVSHDLRAPLASILGAIEYSETETSDPDMLENLGLMKTSAKRLDGFILDILDYSKNARAEIEKEEIDFDKLLKDVAENLKFMSSCSAIVCIRIKVNNKMPFYSDKTRINIILNNLISNAIRYCNPDSSDPSVVVHVDLSPHEANISILDNGIGIDKSYHDKIFGMFYRVSKQSVGSGLGLYIVKEAVEKLQGTINIVSEPGKGTEFKICLPNFK